MSETLTRHDDDAGSRRCRLTGKKLAQGTHLRHASPGQAGAVIAMGMGMGMVIMMVMATVMSREWKKPQKQEEGRAQCDDKSKQEGVTRMLFLLHAAPPRPPHPRHHLPCCCHLCRSCPSTSFDGVYLLSTAGPSEPDCSSPHCRHAVALPGGGQLLCHLLFFLNLPRRPR